MFEPYSISIQQPWFKDGLLDIFNIANQTELTVDETLFLGSSFSEVSVKQKSLE